MTTTQSADGTMIAFHTLGAGPGVVIVNGAMSTAADAEPIAAALADAGFRAVTYDRRGRVGSGDTAPYAPAREAEDLAAVIEAVGGAAAVLGHSSGAIIALYAGSIGVPVGRLFLSEPPFNFGDDAPEGFEERLQRLIDAGHPDEAVITFQREAVGLPEQVIDQIRQAPFFSSLVALAQSVVYDATLTRQLSNPTAAMTGIESPVTILCGVQTFPDLSAAAQRLAELMPQAEFLRVAESVDHRLDPAATTWIVAGRVAGPLSPSD